MMDKLNQTGLGVRDAMDFWLSQHDVSVPAMFEESIRDALNSGWTSIRRN